MTGGAVLMAAGVTAAAWLVEMRHLAAAASAASEPDALTAVIAAWQPTVPEALVGAATWLPAMAALAALVHAATRRSRALRGMAPVLVVLAGAAVVLALSAASPWVQISWGDLSASGALVEWPLPLVPWTLLPRDTSWTPGHPVTWVVLAVVTTLVVAALTARRGAAEALVGPRRPSGVARVTAALLCGGLCVLGGVAALALEGVTEVQEGYLSGPDAVWSLASSSVTLAVALTLAGLAGGGVHGFVASGVAAVWLAGPDAAAWFDGGADALLAQAGLVALALGAASVWRPAAVALDGLLGDHREDAEGAEGADPMEDVPCVDDEVSPRSPFPTEVAGP